MVCSLLRIRVGLRINEFFVAMFRHKVLKIVAVTIGQSRDAGHGTCLRAG